MRNMNQHRRSLLKLASGAGIGLAVPSIWTSAHAQRRQLIVRTPGGPTAIAMQNSYYDPFEKSTGIKIIPATSTNEPVSQVKAIVESGAKTWDMVASFSRAAIEQLIKDGDYLEPHRLDHEPVVQQIPETFRHEFAVGHAVYATPITWRKDKYAAGPQSWKDFFDVQKFPGNRAMRKNPVETLEIALLADGVAWNQIYPLDLDRAFASLDKVKDSITHWWSTPVQALDLILNGDVSMVSVWCNFPVAAKDTGAPLELTWTNNIYGVDMFTLLSGGDKQELCREFIKFCLAPERQADISRQVALGPTNPNAYALLSPERAQVMPTWPENAKNAVELDIEYWANNRDAVTDRFNEWLLA